MADVAADRPSKPSKPAHRRKSWGPFSPLMRRILAVNMIALAILGGGILYLNEFRDNLLDRRATILEAQAQIIAAAIGEAASAGPDTRTIEVAPARQIIGRLVGPTEYRARLFDVGGTLLADSRFMSLGRSVYAIPLPPLDAPVDIVDRAREWVYETLDQLTPRPEVPLYREKPQQTASDYIEVVTALTGEPSTQLRALEDGTLLISVAVPVQRFRRVLGSLLLTVETNDIEEIVRAEQLTTLRVFGVSLGVTLLMSIFLASTIARPISRLAKAADRVRRTIGREEVMPHFVNRRDEIGDLSRSLAEMTQALYRQIDAIESFAADVSHELKNPLSSLRSAVESVQKTDDLEVQNRLLKIIQDDVTRLDRLISDISDASRLDAELSRGKMDAVDLGVLVNTLVDVHRTMHEDRDVTIAFTSPETGVFTVPGIEGRLGQVVNNLLDNAVSFSPPGGTVRLNLTNHRHHVELRVEDDGPGLPPDVADNIFRRFYSERPSDEAFGTHSGLGLSISKQIVEAHSGEIMAENRADPNDANAVRGARFTVRLPRAA